MNEQTIECEDFYDICQLYRHAPGSDQAMVIEAYRRLIDYIDARLEEARTPDNVWT